MHETLINIFDVILSKWYWTSLFFFIFFSLLYFTRTFITSLFLTNNALQKITYAEKPNQRVQEIKNSLVSIFVFSIQAILFQYLYAKNIFQIRFDNSWNCLWEIPVLFIWNEIHFFLVHWLLHKKWFFKHIHHVHHWSKEPTPYSIYSFHWGEAFLLGSVIFFPLFFHDFQIYSVLSLPFMSIIVNLLGHCNHEAPTTNDADSLGRFTFRHTLHHKWSQGNYGFLFPYLDRLFNTQFPKDKD